MASHTSQETSHTNAPSVPPGRADGEDFALDRRQAVPALVGRHEDFLIVSGLAGASKDVAALTGDGGHVFTMAGAMGAATSIGLGLALARPQRLVLVVTGEGELLMNLGALATVAVADPGNLAIVCIDNGRYGETGNQRSHSAFRADVEQIARGAGLRRTLTVRAEAEIPEARALLRDRDGASFVLLRVNDGPPAAYKRNLDPAACRQRFKAALAES